MEFPLRTFLLAFVKEIVIPIRIVSLDSYVNNAQETSRFPGASVLQQLVKTTADLQNRLHHPPLSRLVQSLHP